jgi:hypothetical protein
MRFFLAFLMLLTLQTAGFSAVSAPSKYTGVDAEEATAWQSFTLLIEATTTDPTMPTTPTVNKAYWRRVGQNMEIDVTYFVGNATGATAGDGTYLFTIPDSKTINTTVVYANPLSGYSRGVVGTAAVASATDNAQGVAMVYDTTHLWIQYGAGTLGVFNLVNHTSIPLTDTAATYSYKVSVPIQEWGVGG